MNALTCRGHEGPHLLRLNDQIGASGLTVRQVAVTALHHAFVGEDPERDCIAVARAVLARAEAGDPDVSDEEASALIEAVESGREYMLNNHYDEDPDFPEDAAAAALMQRCSWLETCFR